MVTIPIHFFDEPIKVYFKEEPLYEKDPPCPQGFTWSDVDYPIVEVISERRDYERKGRMADNMTPEHSLRAAKRGSWGVGRYYFIVSTATGQIFEIYYDRAPKNASDRKGSWFVRSEHQRT